MKKILEHQLLLVFLSKTRAAWCHKVCLHGVALEKVGHIVVNLTMHLLTRA
jgi:hypothetical protein